MTKKEIRPMDRKEWDAMKHDSKHFIPSRAYDNYDFLKVLSLKKKEVKDKCE